MMATGDEAAHAIDDAVRLGAVADEIAEHDHGVVAVRGGRVEHGVERVDVRVDVAQDQVAHALVSQPIEDAFNQFFDGRDAASSRRCACW